MKARHCCQLTTREGKKAGPPAPGWQRGGEIAGWILPSAILAVMPKCPVCLAMYVALFSGVGISVANAARLRTSLLVLSVAALFGLALRRLCRVTSQDQRS